MSGPRSIHQTAGFVLLVFGKHAESASIQFSICPAGEKRGHAANRQNAVLVASLRQQLPQLLKERNVMRNRVSIRKDPVNVFEVEVDQTGHVIPATEI